MVYDPQRNGTPMSDDEFNQFMSQSMSGVLQQAMDADVPGDMYEFLSMQAVLLSRIVVELGLLRAILMDRLPANRDDDKPWLN